MRSDFCYNSHKAAACKNITVFLDSVFAPFVDRKVAEPVRNRCWKLHVRRFFYNPNNFHRVYIIHGVFLVHTDLTESGVVYCKIIYFGL